MHFCRWDVAERQGIALGQTSDRLRNRQCAASVGDGTGHRVGGQAIRGCPDLCGRSGDQDWRTAPIAVGDTCAMCHGPAKFRPPDVDALLKATYPHDRANDYTNGDLRGFYWAEVPKVDNTQ